VRARSKQSSEGLPWQGARSKASRQVHKEPGSVTPLDQPQLSHAPQKLPGPAPLLWLLQEVQEGWASGICGGQALDGQAVQVGRAPGWQENVQERVRVAAAGGSEEGEGGERRRWWC